MFYACPDVPSSPFFFLPHSGPSDWTCLLADHNLFATGFLMLLSICLIPIAACRLPWKTCCQAVRCQWCLLLHLGSSRWSRQTSIARKKTSKPICTILYVFLPTTVPRPILEMAFVMNFLYCPMNHQGILAAQICPTACFILWNNETPLFCKCASLHEFDLWRCHSSINNIHRLLNGSCLRWKPTLDIWKVLLVWPA